MKSNTGIGPADKGSKFWMQKVVNTHACKNKLDEFIGLGTVNWLSPLKKDNFIEYKLNKPPLPRLLGFNDYAFWPRNQPQGDASGLAGKTLVLVEAKAHPGEVTSKLSATSPESITLIEKSMKEVYNAEYSEGNFKYWVNKYYQLGNRLTFLHKLNDLPKQGGFERVILILLNFINDETHISTTLDEWESHYSKVIKEMAGSPMFTNDNIKLVFFDTKGLGDVDI